MAAAKRLRKGPDGEKMPMTLCCSFCLTSQHEVAKLVAGPGVAFICAECVALCAQYIAGRTLDLSHFIPPPKLPTERLVAQLPAVEATVRGKRTQFPWVVEELRRREVSWADIGEALGIFRQSAWERFS